MLVHSSDKKLVTVYVVIQTGPCLFYDAVLYYFINQQYISVACQNDLWTHLQCLSKRVTHHYDDSEIIDSFSSGTDRNSGALSDSGCDIY